jgi:3-methylcrotonyl-CoA carboxylase alpha subunit
VVAEEEAGADLLTAPMPGRVVKLFCRVGDRVSKGQPLVVMEAMKMEQRFEAPSDGVVTAVHVREGEQVPEGTRLVDIGEPPP